MRIFFFGVTESINRKGHSRSGVGVKNRFLLGTIGIAINKILSIPAPTLDVEKLSNSNKNNEIIKKKKGSSCCEYRRFLLFVATAGGRRWHTLPHPPQLGFVVSLLHPEGLLLLLCCSLPLLYQVLLPCQHLHPVLPLQDLHLLLLLQSLFPLLPDFLHITVQQVEALARQSGTTCKMDVSWSSVISAAVSTI